MQKEYKNFVMRSVWNAGHFVPTDQPEVSEKMLNDFILKHRA